jgi:membrane-bound lytic murein transglycosylase D
MKSLSIIILFTLLLFSDDIIKKYPAYTYVLSEFDIESSYIYDNDFDTFISKNEDSLKKFYNHSIQRGDIVIPTIKRGLIDNSLSDLLVYVSMVESGFVSDIKSHKKAVGLWQFMPSTAKKYNLKINDCYDDRCDVDMATKAAIKHFKHLYQKFGKWYLAILAYNCGEGRLAMAIKKAKSDDLHTLLDAHNHYLPKETRDYIKKILLVAFIGESKDNWFEVSYPDIVKVEVAPKTNLKDIAKLLGMPSSKLLRLNAKYKTYILPDDKYSYKIVIPEDKMIEFYKKYQMPPKIIKKSFLISYHIKLGDTLESIAKKFSTTVEDIKVANHLENDYLTVGKLLIIPTNTPFIKHI